MPLAGASTLRLSAGLGSLAVVTLLFTGARFSTNDDALIRSLANGDLGGTPNSHLVFVSSLIGMTLSVLYHLTGSVPWYAILLNCVVVAASVACVRHLTRERCGTIVALLAAAPALIVVLSLQTFTAAAILTTACALALHREGLIGPEQRSNEALAIIVLCLGFSLRFDGAVLAVILCEVVLLAGEPRAWSRRHARFLAIAAVAVLATRGLDLLVYWLDSGWRQFWEFDQVRGQLHSTPRLGRSPQLTAGRIRAGWTEADLDLFRRWLYTDPDTYTTPALSTLVSATDDLPATRTWSDALENSVLTPYGTWLWWAVPTVALILGRSVRRGAAMFAGIAMWCGAGTYLAMFQRFPQRVAVPCLAALALFGTARELRDLGSGRRLLSPIAIAAVACIPAAATLVGEINRGQRDREQLTAHTEAIESLPDDTLLVVVGSAVRLEGESAFARSALDARRTVVLSWSNLSPAYFAQLDRMGIGEPIEAAASRDDVMLVVPANEAPLYVELLNTWLLERGIAAPIAVRSEAGGLAFLGGDHRGNDSAASSTRSTSDSESSE